MYSKMSSKFLDGGSGGGDLSALQNGSFEANLGTLAVDSLTPNDLVRANADKKLISTLVEPSDLNFSVLTNPLAAELVADGVQITAGNVLKTDSIQATTPSSTLNIEGYSEITTTRPLTVASITSTASTANDLARVKTQSIEQGIFGVPIEQQATSFGSSNITNVGTLNTANAVATDLVEALRFENTTGTTAPNLLNRIKTLSIEAGTVGVPILQQATDFQVESITNINQVSASLVTTNTLNSFGTTIFIQDNLEMKSKDILGVGDLTTSTISGFTAQGDINLNAKNITAGDFPFRLAR